MAENPFGIPDQSGGGTTPANQPWNLDTGPSQPGRLNKGWAEKAVQGAEAVFNKMGNVLENRKAFGRSIASFALRGVAPGALRFGAKELAKSVVAWSGMAGAVGGGLTGTMAAGAFVGAVSGAVVEYARQVNKNLDTRLAGVNEADPALVGRKKAFLRKMKELRRTEVLKPNDYRKLGRAAVFGAVAGAGAGALVEHVPQLSEFIKEHTSNVGSVLRGVGEVPEAAIRTAGDVAGAVGRTTGDIAGAAGETIGDAAGAAGRTAGDVLGGATHLPVVGGDVAGGAWGAVGQTTEDLKHTVGLDGAQEAGEEAAKGGEEAVKEVAKAPEGFVPAEDYNQLKEQAEELSRQNDELRQALNQAREGTAGAVATPEAPSVPSGTESIPPTIVHLYPHEVSGSVLDNNLTYDGKPWVLFENGTKNIGHLFQTLSEDPNTIIHQDALASNLQQATNLWTHGQLTESTNPDLYRLFHLSNGTASIYKDLLDKDTLLSLENLGILDK